MDSNTYFSLLAVFITLFIIFLAGLGRLASLNYGIYDLFYVPYPAVLLIVGVALGAATFTTPDLFQLGSFLEEVNFIPGYHLFLPAYIFKTVYMMDWQDFLKCWRQVLLLGFLGFFGMTLITGSILGYLCGAPLDWVRILTYGAVINSVDIGDLFLGYNRLRQLRTLFEGEALLTSALSTLIHAEHRKMYNQEAIINYPANDYNPFLLIIINIVVALVLGKLYLFALSGKRTDFTSYITTSIGAAYFLFAVMEYLCQYGIISLIGFAMMICPFRRSSNDKISDSLTRFWSTLHLVSNFLVITLVGIVTCRRLMPLDIWQSIGNVVFLYICVLLARTLVIFLLYPFLKRTGFGFCWRRAIVTIWCNIRSTYCMGLILTMHNEIFRDKFIVYGIGLIFLNQVINGLTTKALMLGLGLLAPANVSSIDKVLLQLEDEKNTVSNSLHTNSIFADSHWGSIQDATMLRRAKFSRDNNVEMDTELLGVRYKQCDECRRMVPERLKASELLELELIARKKILKAQKVSYIRQHAQELLSTDAYNVLSSAVEAACNNRKPVIKIADLKRFWTMNNFQAKVYSWLIKHLPEQDASDAADKNHWFISVVHHVFWDLFMMVAVVLHWTKIVWELFLSEWDTESSQMVNGILLVLLIFQLLSEVLVFGSKDRIRIRFILLDFVVLIFCIAHLIAIYVNASKLAIDIITSFKLLRILRMILIISLIQKMLPYVSRWLNILICHRLLLGYDVGKGYIVGNDETLKLLPRLGCNLNTLQFLQDELEMDRLTVFREIDLLQQYWPIPVSTLKTRQCALSLVHLMEVRAGELSNAGLLDEEEESHLLKELSDQRRRIEHEMMAVTPKSAREFLSQTPWLSREPKIVLMLCAQTVIWNLNAGSIVMRAGDKPAGLFLVCSGLIRCEYIPNEGQIEAMHKSGELPNLDMPRNLNYSENQVEYAWNGSMIGEIGILTRRANNVTVTCKTNTLVAFISMNAIEPHLQRLEMPMWRTVGIRLATLLLTHEAGYEAWSQDRIKARLEQCLAPDLAAASSLDLANLAQHVFLLDGVVADSDSGTFYTAPCVMSCQHLMLPRHESFNYDYNVPIPRLLILPLGDLETVDVTVNPDGSAVLVSDFKWCPLHDPSGMI